MSLQAPTTDTLLVDLIPGPADSKPADFIRAPNFVFFAAGPEGFNVRQPWVTDGTAAGTLQLPISSLPRGGADGIGLFGSEVLFSVSDFTLNEFDYYLTDGTSAGTRSFELLDNAGVSTERRVLSNLTVLADRGYFGTSKAFEDSELWSTDGTTAGTWRVGATPGLGSATIISTRTIGDRVWYLASGFPEMALFSTDGTVDGEQLEVLAGSQAKLSVLGEVGDRMVYGRGLPDGTTEFASKLPGQPAVQLGILNEQTNNKLYPLSPPSNGGLLLVRTLSDGTQRLVHTDGITPGWTELQDLGAAAFIGLTAVPGGAAFFLESAAPLLELWFTDGTAAGTQPVAVAPFPTEFLRGVVSIHGDQRVVISAWDSYGFGRLWLGSPTGITPLIDPSADGELGRALAFTIYEDSAAYGAVLGDRYVFQATSQSTGAELHAVDIEDTGGPTAIELPGGCANPGVAVPRLSSIGSLFLGGLAELELAPTAPGTPVLWFRDVDLLPTGAPGSCGIALPSPIFAGLASAGAAGAASLTAMIPTTPALVGQPIRFQALAFDPAGPLPGLGALSNALELTVAP